MKTSFRTFTVFLAALAALVISACNTISDSPTRGPLATRDVELLDAQLTGRVDEPTGSVAFRLRAQVRAEHDGARLQLLAGRVALADKTSGDGWHVELVAPAAGQHAFDLVCDRHGTLTLDLAFVAGVQQSGDDWRALDFAIAAGAIVPLTIEGLDEGVSFKVDAPVVPVATNAGWRGFLPGDGVVSLAWRHAREAAEGTLFFTSTELAEVRLGAGLLRQVSQVSFRVMQGKLGTVRCRLDGPGEITGVEGAGVVAWKVLPAAGDVPRVLEVRFSRPVEAEVALVIRSQAELGNWPVRAEPLRLTPEGGVRHSGFVRVANSGAVRLEVAEAAGLMQLAPAQWPGGAVEAGARQVFVYRFPAAIYGYRVLATQIQPEVGVSAIATYELGETARVLNAALELDVREAPLRDWTLRIPADYTVVSVTGSDVADYAAESDAKDGTRALRILFGRAIEGRQLLQLKLEKNQPAAAGDWSLPALQFPGAKSVRGHLGAVATPGFRLVPARVENLAEVPLAFFPRQTAGLQQAWRLRDGDWTAELRVEALGQSVQADVFHLYALKEGAVTASVLLNYFVVGAPASEWRIAVPPGVGNLDVTGQNVRRDWRREGDTLIVSLHQPVLGAATLLVTFEQPMSARGGVLQPGLVRPLGVQSERGFVQVVSPLQVKHEIVRAEGALLKLEPTELPAEYRPLTSAPSVAVYHYTARPFTLELKLDWFTPGETVEQVVDFAKLSSQVSRDGQVVTEAKFFVKTRGQKALRVVLPAGAKLWEARVDNELVNARVDGEHTLIPLPARPNPNEPVAVALRVGQAAGSASGTVRLVAPRTAGAATVISEWTVRGESGRQLVARGGNAELLAPALTEDGFEWIARRGDLGTFVVLALGCLAAMLLHAGAGRAGWRTPAGMVACLVAIGGAAVMTLAALANRRVNLPELSFSTTMVPAGESVVLQLDNVSEWRALLVGWGMVAAGAGIAILVGALLVGARGRRLATPLQIIGTLALAAGLLAQHGGAVLFFLVLGLAVFVRLLVPAVLRWRRERREEIPPTTEPGAGAAAAVSSIAILLVAGLVLNSPKLHANSLPVLPAVTKPAQSLVQTWSIKKDRLFGDFTLTVRGVAGDTFVLLRPPAVLTEFKGEHLRLARVDDAGLTTYQIALEREGTFTAHAKFEMPVADRTPGIALPTGTAVTQRLTIDFDQGGWEFSSPAAVQIVPTPGLGDDRSGATLTLAPADAPAILFSPRKRDLTAEATVYFAEIAHLYTPGPGAVNGAARVTVRPVQGRVTALEFDVPAGLTVGDVSRGPVGAWRFDPEKRRLNITVEPAQAATFAFTIETQLGAGDLPYSLALEPLRAVGAAGDSGMIALAFGGDAQPEAVHATDLTAVNAQDFDTAALGHSREAKAPGTVQHAWRYGATGGRVELKVAPVAPEVRVTGKQVFSLDDDRLVLAADLRVAITRVGLFKLSFALPEGLEVEAISGPALSHWTEAKDPSTGSGQVAQRVITLHLNGRTLGEQVFTVSLAGAAPRAQNGWPLPRLLVREATRQTGEALVVPGKGLRVRAASREKVTQLDPRSVGGMLPGTLAFRLLQEDWVLQLDVEALAPWVTVQALQEVTLREGQTLTRLALRYRVENAAIKTARVKLPGLGDDRAGTVRATGSAVSEIVRVAGTPDEWEVRFQRAIAGDTDVQIEFQGAATREAGRESVGPVEFVGARSAAQFVAVRSGGRLELEAVAPPRGWSRSDWSAVPAALHNRSDRTVPALCFRVVEPEGPLAIAVRRHDVAEALKLRVTQGDLLTLFAPDGGSLTSVDLKVEVLEKSALRARLPRGAQLFNALVNGERVSVVREDDAWLFYVFPSTSTRTASVRLIYAATDATHDGVALAGPGLSVPLENVTWRVVLPPGYDLRDYRGALRLREEQAVRSFSVDDYTSFVSSKRSADAKDGMSLLSQASAWAAAGEQEKAVAAFNQATNSFTLDAASNEDARVQLRNLKTQQAVVSLNTRRQRLYFDNGSQVATRNDLLEQAASRNPFMQGRANFKPQEVDQLLQGNTSDENSALRSIAARIVDQQLAAEPAPSAIEVTLPERGRVVTFTRSLQVDGTAPLTLTLGLGRKTLLSPAVIMIALLGLATAVAMARTPRVETHANA